MSEPHVHRIHLKGPWEFMWLSTPAFVREGAAKNAKCFLDDARLRMPVEWRTAFAQHAGTVRFRRQFNWPTNLDPGDRAYLVFEGFGGTGEVRLNDELLGPLTSSPASFEVTDRLRSRDLLEATLTFDPQTNPGPGGLWGPVVIAIHESEPK